MASIIPPRLKELRLKKRESLQELADAVGASKAHIWELEIGKSRNPSIELVTKLAAHFRVPVEQLVGGDPGAPQEDPELVAMFRDLKEITEPDRVLLKSILETMKKRKDREE